jgi:hypothetical protein
VRLERLDKLEEVNYFIGNRTRDLPACTIAPQLLCYYVAYIDEKIILKLILKDVYFSFQTGPLVSFCEHSSRTSDFMKFWKCIE